MMEMILVNHFRELRFKSTIVNRAGIWPLGGFIIISFPIFVPNGKLISSSAESQICCCVLTQNCLFSITQQNEEFIVLLRYYYIPLQLLGTISFISKIKE